MRTRDRRRVLIVTRNLPPLLGGMERLNWHMAEELTAYADVRVIGPEGASAQAPPGVVVHEVPLSPLWAFLARAWLMARREAKIWKPDVVLAGSALMAPAVKVAARTCGAMSAAYVHGLDVAVSNAVYRAIWWPALRSMNRVIANSRATAALCRTAGVRADALGIVHPGVGLPAPLREAVDLERFRQKYGLGGGRLLLSVGRLTERKGLREFVTHALPRIVASDPEVLLAVVGDAPVHALRARAQTPESIRKAAAEAGVADRVRFLGAITDFAELGRAYRAASVHVFPVQQLAGDPEGFGMVAVEAAAHGLRTVAFATGGVVDAVAEGVSGELVAPGDYVGFADAVIRTLARQVCDDPECQIFARRFAWAQFGCELARQLHLKPGTSELR